MISFLVAASAAVFQCAGAVCVQVLFLSSDTTQLDRKRRQERGLAAGALHPANTPPHPPLPPPPRRGTGCSTSTHPSHSICSAPPTRRLARRSSVPVVLAPHASAAAPRRHVALAPRDRRRRPVLGAGARHRRPCTLGKPRPQRCTEAVR